METHFIKDTRITLFVVLDKLINKLFKIKQKLMLLNVKACKKIRIRSGT